MADWKNIAGNAAGAAAVAYGLATFVVPGAGGSYLLNGTLINVAKGYALVAAASSIVTDLTGAYILPLALQNPTLDMILQKAGNPIVAGAANLGLYWILNPTEFRNNGLMAFAIGAGAQVGGNYINDSFLKPLWGR